MLSSGDAASAVMASATIPGVFPPVRRHGRVLIDGGIAKHAAIGHAVDCGADQIYLLPPGRDDCDRARTTSASCT